MKNKKNEHILNASTSLLGFSFIAITMMREFNLIHANHIDQFAALDVGIFTVSTLLSFLSIRSEVFIRARYLEDIAEYFFMAGLVFIVILVMLIEVRLV